MDVLRDLFEEVRRLQFMVFVYGQEELLGRAVPLEGLSQRVRLSPEQCADMARSLASSGMLDTVQEGPGSGVRVRLTSTGREWIESLGSPLPHGPMCH
jgi:hypothetical protein